MRERRAAAGRLAADEGLGTFDARAGVTMGSAKGAFLRIAGRGGPKRGESYPGPLGRPVRGAARRLTPPHAECVVIQCVPARIAAL